MKYFIYIVLLLVSSKLSAFTPGVYLNYIQVGHAYQDFKEGVDNTALVITGGSEPFYAAKSISIEGEGVIWMKSRDPNQTESSVTGGNISFYLTQSFNISPKFILKGRLGYMPLSYETADSEILYGAQVIYKFNKGFGLAFDYTELKDEMSRLTLLLHFRY